MRTIFVTWIVTFLVSFAAFSQVTCVERCFEKTDVLTSKLRCKVSDYLGHSTLELLLQRGETFYFSSSGNYGKNSYSQRTTRVQCLGETATRLGYMGSAVRFISQTRGVTLTITVPCNQTIYAAVGIGNYSEEMLPDEHIAECTLERTEN